MRRLLPVLAALPLFALGGDQRPADAVSAGQAFLASLDRDLHRRAVQPFEGDYRTLWRYTPATRQGIDWSDLDPDQTAKAHALIKATLSDAGYKRTQDIRTVEEVLSGIERSTRRDKNNYVFTFFNVPSETKAWGWRYEGHHISLNFTYKGSALVASTPQFFGSNPAEVPDGERRGMRMLAKEEDMAIAFLASLTQEQKNKAMIAPQAPREIFTAENRTAEKQPDSGIKHSELTKSQQDALMALIKQNAVAQRADEAARLLKKIEDAGKDNITFAWMGASDRSGAHYYRIQGPTFLIEFDNIQNRANHIHLVWRDFDGDFGRDVLKEHYERHADDPHHGH